MSQLHHSPRQISLLQLRLMHQDPTNPDKVWLPGRHGDIEICRVLNCAPIDRNNVRGGGQGPDTPTGPTADAEEEEEYQVLAAQQASADPLPIAAT